MTDCVTRADKTPADFPRLTEHGWPSGAATKYVASFDGQRYSTVISEQQLYERYCGCCDLLDDLVLYCKRKMAAQAELDEGTLHQRVVDGLRNSPQVGITQAEMGWVMQELSKVMKWKLQGTQGTRQSIAPSGNQLS